MTTANVTDLTKLAMLRYKAGDRPSTAHLLTQVVLADPSFEMPWLWLSSCLTAASEKRYRLEQALLANPHSQPATNGLNQLGDVAPLVPAALN